jgi:hypothetical protein
VRRKCEIGQRHSEHQEIHESQDGIVENSQCVRGSTGAHAASIFAKSCVAPPVQTVLDMPVVAHELE